MGGTDPKIPELVIRYLGRIAWSLVVGLLVLAGIVVGKRLEPTAAVIGLLVALSNLASGSIGALGSILVSTRSGPDSSSGSATVTPAPGSTLTMTPATQDAEATVVVTATAAAEPDVDPEPPYDPAAHTVADVLAYLETADDDERQRVLDAEAAGKRRARILALAEGD